MKEFPILYKRIETGNIQQWQIIAHRNSFYTVEGVVNGKLTQSKPTFCDYTNQGKSNERTPDKQAEFMANAKWKKQIEKGYVENIHDIDASHVGYYKPMLAFKYEDYASDIVYPCFISYKIDGIRCVITRDGAQSRNGKTIVSIPHILESLKYVFEKYPDTILDGELYNHKLHDNFNEITSIVKKTKPSVEDLLLSRQLIQYHIFDAPRVGQGLTEKHKYSDRIQRLSEIIECDDNIQLVPTYTIHNEDGIIKYHDKFVQEGYEGAMVRIDGQYENKRSRLLLKVKKFHTEEFIIVDIREGRGNKANMAGNVVCRTKYGKTFSAGINGDEEYCRELLINKDDYILKKATVKFFAYTPDGVPRFPKIIEMNRVF